VDLAIVLVVYLCLIGIILRIQSHLHFGLPFKI